MDLRPVESAIGQRFGLILGTNVMLKSGLRWLFDKDAGKVGVAESGPASCKRDAAMA